MTQPQPSLLHHPNSDPTDLLNPIVPVHHPAGTRLLVHWNNDPSQILEVDVTEWSSNGQYVKLMTPDGGTFWVPTRRVHIVDELPQQDSAPRKDSAPP